jgi:hypothetical protein
MTILSAFASFCGKSETVRHALSAVEKPVMRAVIVKIGIDLHWRHTKQIWNFIQARTGHIDGDRELNDTRTDCGPRN